jgi:beta-lactam-binding protein with PASTA domain
MRRYPTPAIPRYRLRLGNERTGQVTPGLPDLRGVNVVEAKARLTALNINTVISGRSEVPTALRTVVREQLPPPGSAFDNDGEHHVLLLTTKGPPDG